MRKTNVTISFESEKLDALNYYINKKDVKLQNELTDTIQKLYEKHVPQSTREYIEDKLSRESLQNKAKKVEKPKLIAPSNTVGSH